MRCRAIRGNLPVQAMKCLGASLAGTAVHYGLLGTLVRHFGISPLPASTCGAVTGAVVIYVLNYYAVFRSTRGHIVSSSRFFLVAALGAALNGWVLSAAMTRMELSLAPAQVLATGVQFSIGFAVNRSWTF